MNIADRSLALVDLALGRRFAFVTLEPRLGKKWCHWVVEACGVEEALALNIEDRINALNNEIAEDLGVQFQIGDSYVTPVSRLEEGSTKAWFSQVAETEIAPLLEEYWLDHPDRARKAYKKLVAGC